MPRTLHAALTKAAERENVSLNQFITDSLASVVGWRRGATAAETSAPAPINQEPGAGGLTAEPLSRLAATRAAASRRRRVLRGPGRRPDRELPARRDRGHVAILVLIAART